MKNKKLMVFVAIAVVVTAVMVFFKPAEYLTLDALKANHASLVAYTEANLGMALAIYALVYI
jgi:hypothetical protein